MVWAILALALSVVGLALWAMRMTGVAKDAEVDLAKMTAERDRLVMDIALEKDGRKVDVEGRDASIALLTADVARLRKERDAAETPAQRADRFARMGAGSVPASPLKPQGGKR